MDNCLVIGNGVVANMAQSTMYGWMSRFRKEEPELFGKPNVVERVKFMWSPYT